MTRLILASTSRSRARLLDAAKVPFEAVAPTCDEELIKPSLRAEGIGPRDQADALAEMKAASVARKFPDALVLGCDQILSSENTPFDKPSSIAEAREQLKSLRGKAHYLYSALVIFEGGRPVWRHLDTAKLEMRDFSDAFLEDYLKAMGDEIMWTVGGYQLEGTGVQLFSAVRGDLFGIQGLPLVPLLNYLRVRGVMPS